jgi:hypothetical protein
MARRPEHRKRPRRDRDRDRDRDRGKPGKKGTKPGDATTEIKESGKFPQSVSRMPAAAQAGMQPQDYPDDAATFGTGPAEAVQYHYRREDLYAEQYAQEQIAAEQQASAAGAGPGQVGVRSG